MRPMRERNERRGKEREINRQGNDNRKAIAAVNRNIRRRRGKMRWKKGKEGKRKKKKLQYFPTYISVPPFFIIQNRT